MLISYLDQNEDMDSDEITYHEEKKLRMCVSSYSVYQVAPTDFRRTNPPAIAKLLFSIRDQFRPNGLAQGMAGTVQIKMQQKNNYNDGYLFSKQCCVWRPRCAR